jgi:hypothetical protein
LGEKIADTVRTGASNSISHYSADQDKSGDHEILTSIKKSILLVIDVQFLEQISQRIDVSITSLTFFNVVFMAPVTPLLQWDPNPMAETIKIAPSLNMSGTLTSPASSWLDSSDDELTSTDDFSPLNASASTDTTTWVGDSLEGRVWLVMVGTDEGSTGKEETQIDTTTWYIAILPVLYTRFRVGTETRHRKGPKTLEYCMNDKMLRLPHFFPTVTFRGVHEQASSGLLERMPREEWPNI